MNLQEKYLKNKVYSSMEITAVWQSTTVDSQSKPSNW